MQKRRGRKCVPNTAERGATPGTVRDVWDAFLQVSWDVADATGRLGWWQEGS